MVSIENASQHSNPAGSSVPRYQQRQIRQLESQAQMQELCKTLFTNLLSHSYVTASTRTMQIKGHTSFKLNAFEANRRYILLDRQGPTTKIN